jgi:HEAT repeat protein
MQSLTSWTFLCLLALVIVLPTRNPVRAADSNEDEDDKEILEKAKLGSDGPSLLEFLRKRTLTDEKHAQLRQYIRDLGSKRFAERRRASRELVAIGTPALPLLRQAVKDTDVEVARRAQKCLKSIQSGPGPELPAAVVRLLVRRPPPKTVETLLAYLPFADNEVVAEEVFLGLHSVNRRDKQVAPALIAGLHDQLPVRRGVAAYVVGKVGDAKQRAQVCNLLKDADLQVRFQAAYGLAAGGDKRAVPVLLNLLREGPDTLAWQAEEVLFRIAGEKSPAVAAVGDRNTSREKIAAAWETWWRDQGPKLDWKRIEVGLLGGVIVAELETDTIWEVSPGGKIRWQMDDIQGPYDVQVLSGGRFLIAEYLGQRVTERDRKGTVLWEKEIDDPVACRRLPNGNTFIATSRSVLEIAPGGKEVYACTLPKEQQPVYGAHVVPGSHSVFLASKEGMLVLDTTQKGPAKKIDLGGEVSDVQGLSGGQLLITVVIGKTTKLKRIDAAGKQLEEWTTHGVSCATRLTNGNLLAGSKLGRTLCLLDSKSSAVIWKKRTEGRPIRLCRR